MWEVASHNACWKWRGEAVAEAVGEVARKRACDNVTPGWSPLVAISQRVKIKGAVNELQLPYITGTQCNQRGD
ncbi:hypothetical protein Pmani_037714 [Petrolisthes manimaculis]|uniref:Uncharacterized protein n=1 Tax=Petrolisthes manimaculis TaxID=1843537 RepID=A0AAE1NFV6_9EUCA|nr:hypothetical protein Pmani_037714 [Petrolisthes manimaculis]